MRFSAAILPVVLLLVIPGLSGEESRELAPASSPFPEGEGEGGDAFFPIHTLLWALDSPEIPWRPDWPAAIPPDGFTLRQGEAAGAITLILDSRELRLRTGKNGCLEEFPVLYGGDLVQARAHFREDGGLRGFTLEAGDPWNVEFLPAGEAPLLRARLSRAGAVYFAVLQCEIPRLAVPKTAGAAFPETWYDGEGKVLGVFNFRFGAGEDGPRFITGRFEGAVPEVYDEQYHFDSFGNIRGIETPRGSFSALYNRTGRPRYWERPIPPPSPDETAEDERDIPDPDPPPPPPYQTLTLQWDERGLLVRITRFPPSPEEDQGEESRYEYTLDERGNWIERRERRMIRQSGLLVPDRLTRIRRIIEYLPED